MCCLFCPNTLAAWLSAVSLGFVHQYRYGLACSVHMLLLDCHRRLLGCKR